MNVKRSEFSDAPIELIDQLAGNYFFSSTVFAKLWESMGGKPVYWMAVESGRILAVLSGVEFGRGSLRRFQSMPNGCYGRILFNVGEEIRQSEIATAMVSRIIAEKYVKAFITDFHKTILNSSGFEIEEYTVFMVDISSVDWEPPDQKLRQQIHKAEREKLVLEKFSAPRHLDQFMRLVHLHEKRRQTKIVYTRQFFESLAVLAADDSRINWVWCEQKGQAVASHIFFIEGSSLMHWQMYYDEALSHLQATKLIPYLISKEAAKKGIKYLNLGLSPSGAEGAEFYKRKWGGTPCNYNCCFYKSFLGKLW